ncbi:MAG: A/G-specific adenine glycosylase [Rhodoferax sp.]|nr:A/G-specific adenine glycosylase [Rhodoferax sp.]
MPSAKADFATRVVQWQQTQGRNDLPWQNTRDPYRVWLSEIMLQQTQVATVKAYFARFLARCPDVAALAAASLDEVLGLWSGLGYYSRARNLHRCARQVTERHGGAFPQDAETLATLPGIGPSTAAAIASLCFAERVAILDANVKRVVTRVQGFDADVSVAANARALWDAASVLLPAHRRAAAAMPRYTQGMMDLGAMVCTPKKPLCGQCPVQGDCAAFQAGDPERYPVRSRKLKRSSHAIWMLWAQTAQGAVWLARRPTPGVWAGLYCLPLFDSEASLRQALPPQARQRLQCAPAFTHVLTHKDLHLHACQVVLAPKAVLGDGRWVGAEEWPGLGLPAPIRKLLERA